MGKCDCDWCTKTYPALKWVRDNAPATIYEAVDNLVMELDVAHMDIAMNGLCSSGDFHKKCPHRDASTGPHVEGEPKGGVNPKDELDRVHRLWMDERSASVEALDRLERDYNALLDTLEVAHDLLSRSADMLADPSSNVSTVNLVEAIQYHLDANEIGPNRKDEREEIERLRQENATLQACNKELVDGQRNQFS